MINNELYTGYYDLSFKTPGPQHLIGSPDHPSMMADFKLDSDVSQLFPYINALSEDTVYYANPVYIKFMLGGFMCALYSDRGSAACFESKQQALDFMLRLIDFLNDIHLRRDSIEPDHKMYRHVAVLDIMRLLPRTNCGECGYTTCIAFAAAVSRQEILPGMCPDFSRPITKNAVYPVHDEQGNLLSTVTIDINTANREYDGVDTGNTNNKGLSELTGRETQVLRLLAEGTTNFRIANTLSISPHTVKSHIVHIFNKLGVNDRTQAAVWAVRNKIIQ
jgi:DNA-binding CsgD family transcriptional regulator/ArsR family metal-binding transcriptional regulator